MRAVPISLMKISNNLLFSTNHITHIEYWDTPWGEAEVGVGGGGGRWSSHCFLGVRYLEYRLLDLVQISSGAIVDKTVLLSGSMM